MATLEKRIQAIEKMPDYTTEALLSASTIVVDMQNVNISKKL